MTVSDLKKYKDNLYTSLSRDLSEFEKNFLLISGGILAFSITFIKEIVKIDEASCLILLYISWGFIILSIGLMMFAFLKSSIASDELWSIVDDFIISNQLYKDDDILNDNQVNIIKHDVNVVFYRNKKKLKIFRFISVASFIVGITFLAIYVSVNLSNENKNKSKNKADIINLCITDSIVVCHNNKSIKIILNYGKDSDICSSKTVKTDSSVKANTNTSVETNASGSTKTNTKTTNTSDSDTKR
jgi:hypothetical protein